MQVNLSNYLTALLVLRIHARRNLNSAVFALFISLLLYGSAVSAAELHISEKQLPINLGQYLDYYEDSTRQLSIDDILAGAAHWQRSSQSIPTLGMSNSAHWFSINLSGEPLLGEDLVLSLNTPDLDKIEFYFIQNNAIVSQALAGDSIPFSQQKFPYRIPVIPFELADKGGQTRIFFRVTSSSGVEIPLRLSTISLLTAEQQSPLVFSGALIVLFLAFFCISLILYIYTREAQFQGITLFFAGALAFLMCQTGLGRILFWGESVETNNRLSLIAGAGIIASLCMIGRSLRFHHQYQDMANRVLRFLTYSMLPVALFFLLIPFQQLTAHMVVPLLLLALLVLIGVLFMATITAIQGSKAAMYLVSSWVLIILSYTTLLAYKFRLVEREASLQNTGEVIAILAGIFLLLSVAEFIRSQRDELNDVRHQTKAKGDFLKNVSQEFLAPVHSILSNSKRLLAAQAANLDTTAIQHIGSVIRQSDHLNNLINNVLEMAELESDSFELELELVEMSHFLNEIQTLMSPSASNKGLQLNTQFSASNLLVLSDKSRLQHILVILITNAITYTEKGSILLSYKAVYFQRRLGIEISIQDTGRGMSQAFQQQLFQEFAREEDQSEKQAPGTGLGLSIVKRMIEKLGGEITFESQKNTGSEFFIRLPLRTVKR